MGITAGPDGNLWFTESPVGQIGMINPTTHAISEFKVPRVKGAPVSGLTAITAGSDGNFWFIAESPALIGEINPTTHAISQLPISTPCNCGFDAFGITSGPDGNIWSTWQGLGEIVMINPTTDAITYFPVVGTSTLGGIVAGPVGKLWFAGQGIFMFNPTTHAQSYFATPSGLNNARSDWGLTVGPDGNVWFTAQTGQIGAINPTTDVITEYPVPYANTSPNGITKGPDGNLWFTDSGTNAVGVATLATSQLVVRQQPPSSIAAGSPFGLTVQAEDSSGNPITTFNGTVTVGLAINPGGATLGGTLTATASNGVATFSGMTIIKAASGYTLYTSGGGIGWGVTNAITVTPLAASQLVISTQPSATATAGQPFATQPVVSEEDTYGNVETGDDSTVVTAALASGAGPLQGTTAVTVSGGVATFAGLTDNKAETITLQFSGGGLTSVPSSPIVVSPAAAAKLVITIQPPTSVVVNTGFGLNVAVEDAYGNVVTSASNIVTVALANNPSGAKLNGTTRVTASQGMATFTGLSINKVGSGYTLQVSSSGLTAAVTNAFNVVSSTATSSALTAPTTASTPNPLLAPLVLDSPDLWESLGFKKRYSQAMSPP
jgi:streptogramin lyase